MTLSRAGLPFITSSVFATMAQAVLGNSLITEEDLGGRNPVTVKEVFAGESSVTVSGGAAIGAGTNGAGIGAGRGPVAADVSGLSGNASVDVILSDALTEPGRTFGLRAALTF